MGGHTVDECSPGPEQVIHQGFTRGKLTQHDFSAAVERSDHGAETQIMA